MRVLVLGAAGLLGSNVVSIAEDRGHDVVGTYHSTAPSFDLPLYELDVRENERFRELLIEHELDVVVNCAALTDVDSCESDSRLAYEVNGEAPGELAAACEGNDIVFVHASTDYVFDGTNADPYTETDEPRPVQEYGASKLDGERTVQSYHSNPLIVRLSFVYGVHRSTDELTGFPAWVRGQLEGGEETPLFVDQHITPSRAGSTAEVLVKAAEQEVSGLFHVASRSCVTPYEFGRRICEAMGASTSLLDEGSQAGLDRPATRPEYTCLDVSKVEDRLGRAQPTLDEDLAAISDAL
ncbi:SDR family oxidoreductase [Salinigranum marinum]|uniref:SDR family oxidoreductase n=1 Tax=Salinigranum marinum TaxID=1515595 RepID=UPI002989F763|nr:SDR family oxidoreductase [Salinigranum marinum]